MSGLDLEKMNLFAKKSSKPTPKPVEALPNSSMNIQKAVDDFDREETDHVRLRPSVKAPPLRSGQKPTQNESRSKYDKFIPITTRISEDEYMGLKGIENTIMRSRSKGYIEGRERITFNSVMRCLVANFLEKSKEIDLSEIQNESELNDRISEMFI